MCVMELDELIKQLRSKEDLIMVSANHRSRCSVWGSTLIIMGVAGTGTGAHVDGTEVRP
jgi:hypothetical protein